METFKEVTEAEFYRAMKPLDVTPYPVGDFPYTSYWKTRNQSVIGQSIDYRDGGKLNTRYLLAA